MVICVFLACLFDAFLYKVLSENHVVIIFIDDVSRQGAFYLMVYPDDIRAHIRLAYLYEFHAFPHILLVYLNFVNFVRQDILLKNRMFHEFLLIYLKILS